MLNQETIRILRELKLGVVSGGHAASAGRPTGQGTFL